VSSPGTGSPSLRRGVHVRSVLPTPASSSDRARASPVDRSRWSAPAWGAIGVTALFVALTCWWLTEDTSIPVYDAGVHLETAFLFRGMVRSGNLLGPFNYKAVYPPFGYVPGVLAALIGGVNVASPIIGENLLFVPLLTLGCYQTGRLLFGPRAGMFASIFVLASPLLIAQFHVFMLDAPMMALIAVSIWLILASQDFARTRVAALAGLAVGLGLLTKVQFPLYTAGLVLMVLLSGGWRNWRGVLVFAVVAAVIASPWYIVHLSEFSRITEIAGTGPGADVPPGNAPATMSTTNFLWYFWSVLNSQLLAPLFALLVGGAVWMTVALVRHRRSRGARFEFLIAVFLTWLIITLTPHHDIRYGMPLLPYIAVLATGWIVELSRAPRLLATAVLVLGSAANTLGMTVGVGSEVAVALAHPPPVTQQDPDRIIFYSRNGFLVSSPRRDGDVPGLLAALRRNGVRTVTWGLEQSRLADFSFEGIFPLAEIAGLAPALTSTPEFSKSASVATLIHLPIGAHAPATCTRVSDGTGVWVVRYDESAHKLGLYCPTRRPQFYDLGIA
jgi:4-amino-4-deoxy-L-arabinose transferase-like glycosyltransferase